MQSRHSFNPANMNTTRSTTFSRRGFLAGTVGTGLALSVGRCLAGEAATAGPIEKVKLPEGLDVPLIDLHVHLDNSTIDKVVEIGRQRGVRFGIVDHAGTKENIYPTVISNDEELKRYLAMLKGKGVWCGVQTEWNDWMSCFSREALGKLDYILTDAMTFPGTNGKRVKLWEPDAPQRVDMSNRQAFMDRYVDWYLAIIEKQPIDLLANVSWLPAPLAADYETFWTEKRVQRVVDAMLKFGVAMEISSGFMLPRMSFLRIAKAAGIKFTFGTNGRYPAMGKIDFSLGLAKELGLTKADLFFPALEGKKAAQRRSW